MLESQHYLFVTARVVPQLRRFVIARGAGYELDYRIALTSTPDASLKHERCDAIDHGSRVCWTVSAIGNEWG